MFRIISVLVKQWPVTCKRNLPGKSRIPNLETESRNRIQKCLNRTNKRMIQVWLTSIRLLLSLCIPCKMDDDIRSLVVLVKKRYQYKEGNNYCYHYGIRNNTESTIQNSNQGKLGNTESSSVVKSFWIKDSISSILSIWDTIRTLSNWETGLKTVSDCR